MDDKQLQQDAEIQNYNGIVHGVKEMAGTHVTSQVTLVIRGFITVSRETSWTYPQPRQKMPRMTSELRAQFPPIHASTVPIIRLASIPFQAFASKNWIKL
jgi:hypothetical protein